MNDLFAPSVDLLPPRFAAWFAAQGWRPHAHQLRMLAAARAGRSALLIAPTGGGKTLAGFLPSLAELELPIRAETRTGDTPTLKRQRQREHPPHMLMTTPESLALLLSYPDAGQFFAGLKAVVIDELHAL